MGRVSTELDFSKIRSPDGSLLGLLNALPLADTYQEVLKFYREVMADPNVDTKERLRAGTLMLDQIQKMMRLSGVVRKIDASQETVTPGGDVRRVNVQTLDVVQKTSRKVQDTLAMLQADAANKLEESTYEQRELRPETTSGVGPAATIDAEFRVTGDEFDRSQQGATAAQPPASGHDHGGRIEEAEPEGTKEPKLYRPRQALANRTATRPTDPDIGESIQPRDPAGRYGNLQQPPNPYNYRPA